LAALRNVAHVLSMKSMWCLFALGKVHLKPIWHCFVQIHDKRTGFAMHTAALRLIMHCCLHGL